MRTSSRTSFALVATLAPLLLASAPALAEDVTEPSTGQSFPAARTVDGKSFTLLGTGVRKKFMFKVYAMALYAESSDGKKAFAAGGDHGATWVAHGGFDKLGIMHFMRDVESEKTRGAYTETLADALADSSPIKASAQQFIALFDHDMKKGEELSVHTSSDGKVVIDQAGTKKTMQAPPALVKAIWEIWLGKKPVSEDLRSSLVSRVDSLK